jgi:hypothetical protein
MVPVDFPLEKVGAHKGEVVCSTCHFIHAKTAGLKLLRGFPESALPDDVAKARFKDRRELCRACHGEKLREKSPHTGKAMTEETKKSCSFCHAKEPKEGEEVQFTRTCQLSATSPRRPRAGTSCSSTLRRPGPH